MKRRTWPLAAAALLAAGWIRLLGRSVRWWTVAPGETRALLSAPEPVILAFWHGRLLLIPVAYWRRGRRQVNVLISDHGDGELIARTIGRFGFGAVRGSTRKGALRGLRALIRRMGEGGDLAFTPDGPQGPACHVQPGVVDLARRSGYPILPVTFSTRGGWRLTSWDRFLVPRPLTRGVFCWGAPHWIGPETDREEARRDLEARMNALDEEADRLAGRSG